MAQLQGKILLSAVILLTVFGAEARTCVWKGGGTKNASGHYMFSAADNWEGENSPVAGDSVLMIPQDKTAINFGADITLGNFVCTNAVASEFTGSTVLTLTGTDSVLSVSTKSVYVGVKFNLKESARLALNMQGVGFTVMDDFLRGSGEVAVTGSGDATKTLGVGKNPNFHGTWNIYRAIWIGGSTSGAVKDVFGDADAVINVYGTNASDTTHAGKIFFGGSAEVPGTVNLFHTTSISVTYAAAGKDGIVTFGGNVTYKASSGYNQCQISCGIAGAGNKSGYIFKKDCVCVSGNNAYMNIYSYATAGTYYLECWGKFAPTRSSSNPFLVSMLGGGIAVAELWLHDTLTIGHAWKPGCFRSYAHWHTAQANILPTSDQGFMRIDVASPVDSYLDLHGYDQTMGYFGYADVNEKTFVLKSTGRPATLRACNRNYVSVSGSNRSAPNKVPVLNGKLSFVKRKADYFNGAFYFPNGGDTTGWLGTECGSNLLENASFPNLGGLECTGSGTIFVGAGNTLNPNLTLDVHGMTGEKVRIAAGVDLKVGHVFAESVDLPAGTYCRTGAGVAGATEVAWLAGSAAGGENGTVTVAEHDPVWIWTGKGSSSSFTDAANWGANAAPDLTNAKLTLNLKNAAGKATVVPLDGAIAPAGALNCGDYSKGAVTFGGSGSLALGCVANATNDLKAVFTETTSLTWNGPGTLYLTGKSTSTGTLTVSGGKVVMDYAAWAGKVVVAAGAELVVNGTCDADALGQEVRLKGKLTLEESRTLRVPALYVNDVLVRAEKTYGSTASGARYGDDAHFGGTGTVVSEKKTGMILFLR